MRIIVLLLLMTLAVQAREQNSTELGWLGSAGDTQCSNWNAVRAKKSSTHAFVMKSWVLGFVSGVNNASNADRFLSSFNEMDVMTRVDVYCRNHKTDLLAQAAMNAVTDMLHAPSKH